MSQNPIAAVPTAAAVPSAMILTHCPVSTLVGNSTNNDGNSLFGAGTSISSSGAIISTLAVHTNDSYQFTPRKSTLGQIFYIGGMDSSGKRQLL